MAKKTTGLAIDTKEGRKRLRQYQSALGAFVQAFARVESGMHRALRWHAKTDPETARAVFSGVRAMEASGYLRRLADVGRIGPEEWIRIEPLLAQMKAINDVRNVILHYGAENIAEGEGVATDMRTALLPERARSFPVSAEILSRMAMDLNVIYSALLLRHVGHPALPSKRMTGWLDRALRKPWRYIVPRPSKKENRMEANALAGWRSLPSIPGVTSLHSCRP
jgi:hypothetical protein